MAEVQNRKINSLKQALPTEIYYQSLHDGPDITATFWP